ncbi:helix-turn-helix domain-containing protein [Pseudonocardia sp. EV170527-09]|uniref:helix-turn-helix domain-containing protein n=1 Tax=Pseudonocardia sp. EV170527-09 TaxID=2603411 RepID=UPI0034CE7933
MSSMVVHVFNASKTQEAPPGVGAPDGANIEFLGGTMQVDRTRMYRVRAVAEMLDLSLSTVYRAIESGELDVLRFGTAVRVPGDALAAWLEARSEAAHAAFVRGGQSVADADADTSDAVAGANAEGVA